jgi:hypothetical protein
MSEETKELDQRDPAFTIPPEIVVELKVPLKKAASEEVLSQLSFRPPRVRELRMIEEREKRQGASAAGVFLLSLLSNDKLTDVDVGTMNGLDFQLCAEALEPFLRLKPRTPTPVD